jgi:hypothetical protein
VALIAPVALVSWMDETWQVHDGDRMLIPCQGGPTAWRTASFPPPLEVETEAGVYVLNDDGTPDQWSYDFVHLGATT